MRTVFNRLLAEAEDAPSTDDEGVLHVASADIAEVTALETTRRDDMGRPPLLAAATGHPSRGRGTWAPKEAAVWPVARRPPLPVDLPSMGLVDPLSPRPTIRLEGYSGSDGDGEPLRRTREDRPSAKARSSGLSTTSMSPGPRPELVGRPRQARLLFWVALRQWRAGRVFDARADALLARVFDPDNKTYAATVDRWERRIRDALS